MITTQSGCYILIKHSVTGHLCAVSYHRDKTLEAMSKVDTWRNVGWLTVDEAMQILSNMAAVYHLYNMSLASCKVQSIEEGNP